MTTPSTYLPPFLARLKPGARLAIALALPFVAAAIQWQLWPVIKPFVWFLFFPTAFLSAWLAGVKGGLGSAAISALIVTYVFLPPQLEWKLENPGNAWSIAVFVLMGLLFGRVHERLARTQSSLAHELDATEAKYQAIVEQSLVGIYVLEGPTVVYANPEFARIFGYAGPEEVIGLTTLDLIPPEEQERVEELIRKRAAGEIDEVRERRIGRRKDGSRVITEMHGRVVYAGRN